MQPRANDLDPETRRLIGHPLKVASVEECKRAIDGCRASDFHMGANDRSKRYNRLSHILKGKRGERTTREQIDLFLDIGDRRGATAGVSSVKVRQPKEEVRDAWQFPGNRGVVERGEAAERWLVEQGWTVERGEDGRPSFRGPA